MSRKQTEYLGYVVISKETPATTSTLYVNLDDELVREGDLVAVVDPNDKVKAIGIVTDVEMYTAIDRFEYVSVLPSEYLATRPRIFRKAKINLMITTEDYSLNNALYIRLLKNEDGEELWNTLIPSKSKRVLAGFLIGQNNELIPAYYHSEILLGPEGAHLNVGGISGLAAKTSYLRFLMFSLLKFAEESQQKIRIVAFNVKRLDFLGLHKIPEDWKLLETCIDSWGKAKGIKQKYIELYKRMYGEVYDVMLRYRDRIRYFTYRSDPYRNNMDFMRTPIVYSYGLQDLGLPALIAGLFEEEDEASILQINLVTRIMKTQGSNRLSFKDLRQILTQLLSSRTSKQSQFQYVSQTNVENIIKNIESASPDRRTIEAVIRRLEGFIDNAKNILNIDSPSDAPITFGSLEHGINVVQLYGLSDVEKRVILTATIDKIIEGASELQKQGRDEATVVLVDELNKYAPRTKSPIKKVITEIAARGRDLRISLFGAEQFPSDIDAQVIGNTSTLVIGRATPSELSESVYKVFGALRHVAETLTKGEVLVYHPVFTSPLILLFPPPINDVMRECSG